MARFFKVLKIVYRRFYLTFLPRIDEVEVVDEVFLEGEIIY